MKLPTTPRLAPNTAEELVRLLSEMARQINGISEGTMYAFHSAATAAPTTGDWAKGDTIINSAPAELGTAGSKYVIDKFRCLASGTPGTWVGLRSLTGN